MNEATNQLSRARGRRIVGGLLAAATMLLVLSGLASASPPPLWQVCDSTAPAEQRCNLPRGVASDAENGHVFVADQNNHRILEYNPLGEIVKTWGWDVVASGPGDSVGDEFEICAPEEGDVCKAGVEGAGAGQFKLPQGVAVDSAGNVYVVDFGVPVANNRVEKFNRKGEFELMFGGQVNKTKVAEHEAEEAASEPVTVGAEEENLCPFDPGDACGAGVAGTGPGQFHWSNLFAGSFIAAGAADKLYVGDQERIERFDADGTYQDECSLPAKARSLAADGAGNLYATYFNTVQLVDLPDVRKLSYVAGGECEEANAFGIPEPDEFTHPNPSATAVDSDGNVYAFSSEASNTSGAPIDRIYEFDPAGNLIDQFGKNEFGASTGMATSACAPGNLFVSNVPGAGQGGSGIGSLLRAYGAEPDACFAALTLPAQPVGETTATLRGSVNPRGQASENCHFEFGPTTAYGDEAPCAESAGTIGTAEQPVPVHADIAGLAAATTYHVRLRATVKGVAESGPDRVFKTKGPPVITEQHVLSAVYSEATVSSRVNPEGFPTSCHVDYGTTSAYGTQGPEHDLGEDRNPHTLNVLLTGLAPGTTYHWRVACQNAAVLNGGLANGEDRTFTTYRIPKSPPPCPNEALRSGASATLPDCRAYEMVSPVDKNGADIVAGYAGPGARPDGYAQAALDGDSLTYASKFPAFGEVENSFVFNQYLATRHQRGQPGEGWSTEGIHPPYDGGRTSTFIGIVNDFIAFTPDLCSAWLADGQTPPLEPDAQPEAINLYRRQNCGAGIGTLETLTTAPLTSISNEAKGGYVGRTSVEATTADGSAAFFVAAAPLTSQADPGEGMQIYERSGAALHLVSVLPGGDAAPTDSEVGSGKPSSYPNYSREALSADGSLLYWTAGISGTGRGKLYLRRHPEQGIVSGECSKPTKACTLEVSPGSDAFFWQGTPDGSKALYSEGDDLYQFDLASETHQLIAEEVLGVAGASPDLSRVYLLSRRAIAGSGENSEGTEATADAPNLYLVESGNVSFIATLTDGDVGKSEPGFQYAPYDIAGNSSIERATRVSADGSRLAFESRAPLTAYDNASANVPGKPSVEVYLYEAGGGLICVSCNPSGARPATREMLKPYEHPWEGGGLGHVGPTTRKLQESGVQAAAWIPGPEHPLDVSRILSAAGTRLFFNASDSLLPADTNAAQDVYEWEAPGSGSCTEESSAYFPQNGGCLFLISSGESPFESEFWEASPDGKNVFFNTASSLLPRDPGSIDLYDARVEGGFPEPAAAASCEGEACQPPPASPDDPTPASSVFQGAGNVREGTKRVRCPKGRHRRHGRCVKKHPRHRQGNHKRRAGR